MVGIIHQGHISDNLVRQMKTRAIYGTFDGSSSRPSQQYLRRCRHYCQNTLASLLFTRDVGYHSSGWWKNPDYERCYHLSISFVGTDGFDGKAYLMDFDPKTAQRWAEAIFGGDVKWVWIEGPFTPEGKQHGVHHYRLFCNPAWEAIKPRGEVYDTSWTPADWKSFSDVHASRTKD